MLLGFTGVATPYVDAQGLSAVAAPETAEGWQRAFQRRAHREGLETLQQLSAERSPEQAMGIALFLSSHGL